jgi:nucleotide-binding universal stress UspA family protein
MMPGEPVQVIVVGVTGSVASAAALSWAADEAKRRRARLRVVRVWEQEHRAYYAAAVSPLSREVCEEAARHELAATLHAVLGEDLPVYLSAEVCEGDAERVLADESAGADLLVLGSASGCGPGHPAGPVIRTCLSHAHCPVVVVSPEALAVGPVLAGPSVPVAAVR